MSLNRPDLIFATTKPIGTDLQPVVAALRSALERASYELDEIKISHLIPQGPTTAAHPPAEPASADVQIPCPEYERCVDLMVAGDRLRGWSTEAAARLGFLEIVRRRRRKSYSHTGQAFLLSSLLHPAESAFLRSVYGPRFFQIGVFAPEMERRKVLEQSLVSNIVSFDEDIDLGRATQRARECVSDLLDREQGDETGTRGRTDRRGTPQGIDLRQTFHLSDLFVDASSSRENISEQLDRFVDLIFGDPFGITTPDETGMAHAFAAALQSSSLSRRVGASIVVDGSVVAVGRNDSPHVDHGQVTFGETHTRADLEQVPDVSSAEKQHVLEDLLSRIEATTGVGHDLSELLDSSEFKQANFFDLIEFNPNVHAEMGAILDCARSGRSMEGATLYTTTFPCHECARHIITAGIKRVVYVEPYPKSKTATLFGESYQFATAEGRTADHRLGARIVVEPFIGVAARRHGDLLSWKRRRDKMTRMATPWVLSSGCELREDVESRLPEVARQERDRGRSRLERKLAEEIRQDYSFWLDEEGLKS